MTKVQFEHWYRNNVRLMYYVAYEKLQNREQAEDAVSEAVLRLYSGLEKWDYREEQGFSFEWLMQFTEKEYWEWIQTHELTGGELPTYVPEGFRKVEDVYEYLYVENKDVSWSDEKISPKNQSTYGRFGRVSFPFLLSQEQKKKQVDDQAVLCGLSGTWKEGKRELWYHREIYDIFELKGHEEEKENAAKKLKVGDDAAYFFYDDGAWLYVFGETTLTKIYVDCDEGQGKEFEEAENILVKVAENIRNPAYDANE